MVSLRGTYKGMIEESNCKDRVFGKLNCYKKFTDLSDSGNDVDGLQYQTSRSFFSGVLRNRKRLSMVAMKTQSRCFW